MIKKPKGIEIKIQFWARPLLSESIEFVYTQFMNKMKEIEPPFGFKGKIIPPVPVVKFNDLSASFYANLEGHNKAGYNGSIMFRSEKMKFETMNWVDTFEIKFDTVKSNIDYKMILHEQMPQIVLAFLPFMGRVLFGDHKYDYTGGFEKINPIYNKLRENKSLDIDGRNCIYTLMPALFWDEQLCKDALGYPPQEVVRRLSGLVPKCELLGNGVYTVFNDDPALTYEEFVAMNNKFKPILGLI